MSVIVKSLEERLKELEGKVDTQEEFIRELVQILQELRETGRIKTMTKRGKG